MKIKQIRKAQSYDINDSMVAFIERFGDTIIIVMPEDIYIKVGISELIDYDYHKPIAMIDDRLAIAYCYYQTLLHDNKLVRENSWFYGSDGYFSDILEEMAHQYEIKAMFTSRGLTFDAVMKNNGMDIQLFICPSNRVAKEIGLKFFNTKKVQK